MRCFICFFHIILVTLMYACDDEPTEPESNLLVFPAGYIDSPYIVPDGSAIYFLHSVVSTYDMITANPEAKQIAEYLPNHQGQDGAYWWNTDLYVMCKNDDGSWGQPQNLGPEINTEHLEASVWVNKTQTKIIFTRESVNGDPSYSGTFMAQRNSANEPWGVPVKLPGELGDYASTGFQDFHMAESGSLYFWKESEENSAILYYAESTGENTWSEAELLPSFFETTNDETQPWVNDNETSLFFNRRPESGNTDLFYSIRTSVSEEWGQPQLVQLVGFEDPLGNLVWGEPSFTTDGVMYFVRFNTSTEQWESELMKANKNLDGSYGAPQKLVIK